MKCISNSLIHKVQGKRVCDFFVFSIQYYDNSDDAAVSQLYLNRSAIV